MLTPRNEVFFFFSSNPQSPMDFQYFIVQYFEYNLPPCGVHGLGPRFDPWTGGPEAGTLTTRPPLLLYMLGGYCCREKIQLFCYTMYSTVVTDMYIVCVFSHPLCDWVDKNKNRRNRLEHVLFTLR